MDVIEAALVGLAEKSKRRHERVFLSFLNFVPLEEAKPTHVRIWASKMEKEISRHTLRLHLYMLSRLFKAAGREDLYEEARAIAREIKGAGAQGWVPKKVLTEEQWKAFIEEAKNLPLYWSSLLLFLAYTGCRVSEAVSLTWDRVDFESRQVLIWKSKWGKSRRVPIHPDLMPFLLRLRRKSKGRYLWPSRKGEGHVSRQAVFLKVREIGKRIGIEDMHPHVLRHTFASLLLAKGVDPPVVRDILGHSSLAITDVYSHAYAERKEKAILKL